MNKIVSWVRILTTAVIIAAGLFFKNFASSIPSHILGAIVIFVSIVLLKILEDFIPVISNLGHLRRRLASREFIEGWWVGEVSQGGEFIHFQIEYIVRDTSGQYRISGWCFRDQENGFYGQYNSETASFTLTSEVTLVFSYKWIQQGKEPSYGLCNRTVAASIGIPMRQSGYFIDKNESKIYIVNQVRVPNKNEPEDLNSLSGMSRVIKCFTKNESFYKSKEAISD